MCGIVGILGKENDKENLVREMSQTIAHRGPDDDGFFVDEYVGLGMRRLSIIDLAHGKQPISSADNSLLIFFNGEIYNYKELREELIKKDYVFKTETDTEVILHLYEAYGKSGLSKLRGMFAFCIYDKKSRIIFLARDYFGIKPLYYFKCNDLILGFASEIKALLIHPKLKKTVNDEAVFNYLRFQYNPLEETFFKNVFNLRPGHCMTIDLLSNTFEIEQYWKFEFDVHDTNPPARNALAYEADGRITTNDTNKEDEGRIVEKVREVMRDSVKHHMISDVPVGSFLSGGVDSSVIATLMTEVRKAQVGKLESGEEKVKTFTIGFKELSEGREAKETADMLGTDHTEIIIGKEEYFSILPKLVWHFDEPVADPSAIALYFVAREARKKVNVVLSGEGADELFGGYNIYLAPYAYRKIQWLPKSLIKLLKKIWPEMWGKNYLKRASSKLSDWYIGNASIFSPKECKLLWKSPLGNASGNSLRRCLGELDGIYNQSKEEKLSDSATMQLVDINTWLVGDILAKADKMTMANSLELRVPFLDKEVADIARTLPDNLKWKDGATKYILRKAFEKIIPETARNRRKLGFPIPLRFWLDEEAANIYDTILNSTYIKSHLNISEIEKLIDQQITGKDNSRKIYLLYILAIWQKVFFKDK